MISLLHSVEMSTMGPGGGSQSLGFAVSVGHRIEIAIGLSVIDGTPPTVTDSLGNTYTGTKNEVSGSGRVWLFRVISAFAGTPTISIVTDATAVRPVAAVFDGNWGAGTPTDTDSTTSYSEEVVESVLEGTMGEVLVGNASASALLVAACRTVSDTTFTGPGSPWTVLGVAGNRCAMAYRIVSAAGTNGATFTWEGDPSNGAGAVIASYDEEESEGVNPAAILASQYPGYHRR